MFLMLCFFDFNEFIIRITGLDNENDPASSIQSRPIPGKLFHSVQHTKQNTVYDLDIFNIV